jgi:hypothetical protein
MVQDNKVLALICLVGYRGFNFKSGNVVPLLCVAKTRASFHIHREKFENLFSIEMPKILNEKDRMITRAGILRIIRL